MGKLDFFGVVVNNGTQIPGQPRKGNVNFYLGMGAAVLLRDSPSYYLSKKKKIIRDTPGY